MRSESVAAQTRPTTLPAARRRAVAGAAAAAILGLLIIWVVGFSHVEAIHNAAHDTRHSHAFPCH